MAYFKKLKSSRSVDHRQAQLIRSSAWFDDAWYQLQYPDVSAAKADAALHYIQYGAREGRNPGPKFDTTIYLATYPDVAASGMNPLVHFISHGLEEGRQPKAVDDSASLIMPGLFEGSKFEELSMSNAGDIWRFIAESATPAELLPRVSKSSYSPKISIIIPIYNTPPRFFREVVQSVFAQTYVNWEMCIVDDGSSLPATIEIFDELSQANDERIKTLRLKENRGISGASHVALEMADGEFVAFLDHDDIILPNALSEVIGCIRNNQLLDFVYTDHVMINQEGIPKHYSKKPSWSPEFLLSTNYIVHFKVVRRALLLSVGGLKNEIDNVQDLGVTCLLAAAGANVQHLAKPLYLWREHRASVALSTTAKPGIEGRLIQVYDRYLKDVGVKAKQTWPAIFKSSRTGVFQLAFAEQAPKIALILLSRNSDEDEDVIKARFGPLLNSSVTLHMVCLGSAEIGGVGVSIENKEEMSEFLASIDAEVIVFANTTAQFIGIDWLSRLSNYAQLDPKIGAAGGKILDPWLQIRAGGMLLDATGEYRTICGGKFDSEDGHWFINQITSNVDAVSAQLLATRKDVLLSVGGIDFHAYGDMAGVAYSAVLKQNGYRIVYDPFSRTCDVGRMTATKVARRQIRQLGAKVAPLRTYELLGV